MNNEGDKILETLNGKKTDEGTILETLNGEEEEKVIEKEEKVPYHKDPKVQRYVQKEIERALASRPTETERFIRETKEDDDNYYERLIGNDTPEKVAMVKEAKAREERMLQKVEEKTQQAQLEARQEAEREETEALEELRQGFEDIEENFNVDLTSNTVSAKKTREDFINYISRIAPKDRNGEVIAYPDLEASFEEFQSKVKPTNSRAKDLASRSIDRSADATVVKEETDNSWGAVDKWFAKLKKK